LEVVRGNVLKSIKKAAIKKMNSGKELRNRRGASLEDIARMIKMIYIQGGQDAPWESKRFLTLFLLMFFGIKRFSDVNKLRLKDFTFTENGVVEVWMRSSKTDTLGRGKKFSISNEIKDGITFKSVLMWYLKGHEVKSEDYVFFSSKRGKIKYEECIGYQEARRSLMVEQARLGLTGLMLHSGRIGGASEAAEAGVRTADIMKLGNWKSRAVDAYIRPKGKMAQVSEVLMKKLKL
jgi:integrase